MDNNDVLVLTAAGFFMQWLRQHKWFGDGLTLAASALLSWAMVWLNHANVLAPDDARAWIMEVIRHLPSVVGGVGLAHMASQKFAAVPKWNSAGNGKET